MTWPNRTEPNRLILELAEIGRGNEPNRTEPNRTGPNHDASEKRRPNRIEPEKNNCQTEPNRNSDF